MKIVKATEIKRTKNWRILVYGKPGLGKTSLIKHLKGRTIVLSMDNSHKVLEGVPNVDVRSLDDEGAISFDREHPSDDIRHFLKEVDDVLSGYDNLVIDNISSFQSDWFVEQGRLTKNGISNELQQYNQWTNYFFRVLTAIFKANQYLCDCLGRYSRIEPRNRSTANAVRPTNQGFGFKSTIRSNRHCRAYYC